MKFQDKEKGHEKENFKLEAHASHVDIFTVYAM